MDIEKLNNTIEEAERFLKKAKELRDLMEDGKRKMESGDKYYYPSDNPKESGAVRRASMDLTRSLADLRRC
jgi:hypothetical protein